MFIRPTVFVLGAGANQPYGFPLGIELSSKICDVIDANATHYLQGVGPTLSGDAKALAKELAGSLRRSTLSIDTWLAQNPEFQEVGKYFIACAILQEEKEDKLWHGSWHDDLWRMLYHPGGVEALSEANNVTFITFNYDRSLEQALMIKARSTYRAPVELCAQEIGRLRIIHVHGQIGRLPWQDNLRMTERGYDAQLNQSLALACSKHIKIISETNGETPEYVQAKRALNTAERVHFIGFGYNEDNMKRLSVFINATISGTHLHIENWKRSKLNSGQNPFNHPINTDHGYASVQDYTRHMLGGWEGALLKEALGFTDRQGTTSPKETPA